MSGSAGQDPVLVEQTKLTATLLNTVPSETVQNLGGYGEARWQQAGGEMRWRILVELAGAEGTMEVHEVGVGERSPGGHAAEMLGLTLEEGKATLAGLQRHLVRAQVEEHCRGVVQNVPIPGNTENR